MKTFLLNIPQRLKQIDQDLDVSAELCNKPWTVFNDEGIKQLFIFQPDGTLFITTNGLVSNSSWKYIGKTFNRNEGQFKMGTRGSVCCGISSYSQTPIEDHKWVYD